jgi:hypothetical protein
MTCKFSQGSGGSATLTISAAGNTLTAENHADSFGLTNAFGFGTPAFALFGTVVVARDQKRRSNTRRVPAYIVVALLLIGIMLMAGCGGRPTTSSSHAITAVTSAELTPGHYTAVISATAPNGVQRFTSVNVTVN